jgi:hypothetical protein
MRKWFTVICMLCFTRVALAQDVEALAKKLNPKNLLADKSIKLSGGVSTNFMLYETWGSENRLVPFNYNLAGNLNVSILGKVNMPVRFMYANQNATFTSPFSNRKRFTQPFNRLQLQPTYKGFKLTLGTGSLNFSPYTLAGHRFDGVGLEYNGKSPFYGGVMVGTLLKAVPTDRGLEGRMNNPAYKRTGTSLKLGYKKDKDFVEMVMFRASDRPESLAEQLDSVGIRPAANTVASLGFGKSLGGKLFFRSEVAVSGITEDSRATERFNSTSFFERFGGLLNVNSTTVYRKALSAALDYNLDKVTVGLEYKRVDPDYRTLGAYYFMSDLETYAVRSGSSLFKNKLSLNASVGVQRDNLDGTKFLTSYRWVGSGQANLNLSQNLTFGVNYSTYQNYSNLRSSFDYLTQITPYNALDTLDYRQINNSYGLNAMWQLPSATESKSKKALMANYITQSNKDAMATSLSNASLMFTHNFTSSGLGYQAGITYSKTAMAEIRDKILGPSAGVNFKKNDFTSGLSLMWSQSHSTGRISPELAVDKRIGVGNLTYRMGYTLKKSHALNLNLRYLMRREPGNDRPGTNYSELTTSLAYTYNFNTTLWKR